MEKSLNEYCENYSSKESTVLKEINRQTHLTQINARMLSGHLQGQFLKMIVQMHKPKRILEIGTYTGYSAIAMAQSSNEDTILDTIEVNEELESVIINNLTKSNLIHKVKLHIGDAQQIISELTSKYSYDLIFIDADKINYPNYFHLLNPTIKPGAMILADNVLWSGKVIDDIERQTDEETIAIHHFNTLIAEDKSFEKVILPIRDGLTIAIKIH